MKLFLDTANIQEIRDGARGAVIPKWRERLYELRLRVARRRKGGHGETTLTKYGGIDSVTHEAE